MTKLLRTSHNSLASCPGCDACAALLQAQPMGAPVGRPKLKSSALLAVLENQKLEHSGRGMCSHHKMQALPSRDHWCPLCKPGAHKSSCPSHSHLPSPDATEPHELKDLSPVDRPHARRVSTTKLNQKSSEHFRALVAVKICSKTLHKEQTQ